MKQLLLYLTLGLVTAWVPYINDPTISPGEVNTNLTIDVLTNKTFRTSQVRKVTSKMYRQVFEMYHIDLTRYKPGDFEVDHIISLTLGGANNISNLFPQPYFGPINARHKDRLEMRLRKLVFSGQIPLRQAQLEISTNWIEAYLKYFGTNLWVYTNDPIYRR